MQWLRGLWNSMTTWLGKVWESFVGMLIRTIEVLWDVMIGAVLLAAFGYWYILYVIFYVLWGDIIMETWSPYNDRPSERFKLQEAPPSVPLTDRQNSRINVMTKN